MTRSIEVEFSLRMKDVSPEDVAGLLAKIAAIAVNGQMRLSEETRQMLERYATPSPPPPALETGVKRTCTHCGEPGHRADNAVFHPNRRVT